MKFTSAFGDIITINGEKLAKECYIACLRPQEPTLVASNVERAPDVGAALDLRLGNDSRIELEERVKTFLYSGRKA